MKTPRTRRLSIQAKILIPVLLINLIACVSVGTIVFLQCQEEILHVAREQAAFAATTAKQYVNGDMLAGLEKGDESSEHYQQICNSLGGLLEDSDISYIYAVQEVNGVLTYLFDTDTNLDEGVIGKAVGSAATNVMEQALRNQTTITESEITESDGEYLISAYTPIYDSAGNFICLLASDYNGEKIVEALDKILKQVILVVSAFLVISAAMVILVTYFIRKGLHTVRKEVYDLNNSNGDLTRMLDIRSGDELELIAGEMNQFIAHLREVMSELSLSADKLQSSSGEILNNVTDSVIQVDEVTATMEEMSAMAEETSASTEQIQQVSQNMDTQVEKIKERASEGVGITDDINRRARTLYQEAVAAREGTRTKTLNLQSSMQEKIQRSNAVREIQTLTESILQISTQTNMLALNASIEAARAGEHGRGFAVVAGQVGQLAGDSRRIAGQIQSISQEVISAVYELSGESQAMLEYLGTTVLADYDKLVDTVENYSHDSETMEQFMQEFSTQAEAIRRDISHIAGVISEIAAATNENVHGIDNVTSASTHLSDSVRTMEDEAKGNFEIVEKLEEIIGKFTF